MAANGYDTRYRVACVRCKQRHKPPVGASCPRAKASKIAKKTNTQQSSNSSQGNNSVGSGYMALAQKEVNMDDPQEGTSQKAQKTGKKVKRPTTVEVLDKLNSVMDKFEDLERRLEQQEKRGTSSLSLLSQPSAHSSPKPKSTRHSPVSRSAHHSVRKPLPSIDYLKGDSEIQAEVDKRLRHYENFNREDTSGTSNKLKSGRYRLGDQRVKHLVHWPHEYCSVGDNFKMPTYEDLNVYQWVQGFSRCIIEEADPEVRLHMLQYQGNIMQDALELNWATAKRAHAAVLTEIERGNTSWADQAGVDRIRQRFTQRALKVQGTTSQEEQVKICKRFNEDNCNHTRDHTEGRILYKHACFTCYKAVKRHYPHPDAKCNRAKKQASQSLEKARV